MSYVVAAFVIELSLEDSLSGWNFGMQVKPLDHSHELPPPGKKGRTYICSCMIFLRPTEGAKLLLRKWIEELKEQPWSKQRKANDQPGFNWALNKTAGQVCFSLISSFTMQQNSNVQHSIDCALFS